MCRCLTLYEITTKHFQHFKTTQGYFSVWKKVFYLRMERFFFRLLEINLPKVIRNWRIWLQTSVWAILSALARYREPKEISALDYCFWGYGYTWNWRRHCGDDASISHNNENRSSLRASPPSKGYREKSSANGTRKETRTKVRGKKVRALRFLKPSRLRCTLSRSLATRGCSQSITFLGGCARSLFGEPAYIRNSDEKFELFTY